MKLRAEQARALRLRAQCLQAGLPCRTAELADLVDRVGGIQAQDATAAERGVWTRSEGRTAVELERELVERRAIVRIWAMRGTLHLLPRQRLAPVLSLFGLRFIRTSKRRYQQLGLTESVMEQAVEAIDQALAARGPLSRGELADELAARGLPHEGQITIHLIRRAAFLGGVCYGPVHEGETAFARLEDWLGDPVDVVDAEEALRELARWYLGAFGPAGAQDFASWSGLPITQARTGVASLADDLLELEVEGERMWLLAERADWLDGSQQSAGSLRMLPAFDSYLLAYRDRQLSVPGAFADEVHPGGGIIRSTVLIDGRAAGIWSARRRGRRLMVEVQPFRKLTRKQRQELKRQVAGLGRFHDVEATLTIDESG